MPNFASVTLMGHLGRDPEIRTTQAGGKVCNMALAVTTGKKDSPTTTWWKLIAFDKTAEVAEKYLKKGAAVHILGEPSLKAWESKEGNKGTTLEVTIQRLTMLGSDKKDEASQAADPAPAATVAPKKISAEAPFDDEIPFYEASHDTTHKTQAR
jgi:single-strand DNA-binding protein